MGADTEPVEPREYTRISQSPDTEKRSVGHVAAETFVAGGSAVVGAAFGHQVVGAAGAIKDKIVGPKNDSNIVLPPGVEPRLAQQLSEGRVRHRRPRLLGVPARRTDARTRSGS
jgi:hypothetical protein